MADRRIPSARPHLKPPPEAVAEVASVYLIRFPDGGLLGPLLVAGKVDEGTIRACMENARTYCDAAASIVSELFLDMSEDERRTVLKMLDGRHCG